MKRYTRLGLAGLLTATALLVAACDGAGDADNTDDGQMEKQDRPADQNMKDMDHSNMGDGSGGMPSGMVMENGKYSDERFTPTSGSSTRWSRTTSPLLRWPKSQPKKPPIPI